MTTPQPLTLALLRPPVLQILRAAGFTSSRPSVIDTLVDLTSRYLLILATSSCKYASAHTPPSIPPQVTITDVRLALQEAGALWPQISEMEEEALGKEDLRGVEAFVGWCKGEKNKEIRRIAGFDATVTDPTAAVSAVSMHDGFLAALKRKHAKGGGDEEERFVGTVLGAEAEEQVVRVEGWDGVDGLESWERRLRETSYGNGKKTDGKLKLKLGLRAGGDRGELSESSGSPLTEIGSGSEMIED